jgi:hypothetical protein
MRRSLVVLGLVLLAAAALAPALEALVPCAEPCVDEGQDGQCASEQCCSCCVHARFVEPDRAPTTARFAASALVAAPAATLPPAVDPRDILHVPKPASA